MCTRTEASSVLIELPSNVGPAEGHVIQSCERRGSQIDVVRLTTHAAINYFHCDLLRAVYHGSRERNMTLRIEIAIDHPIAANICVFWAADNCFKITSGIYYLAPRNERTADWVSTMCVRPT